MKYGDHTAKDGKGTPDLRSFLECHPESDVRYLMSDGPHA
jgi:hypothetical protein